MKLNLLAKTSKCFEPSALSYLQFALRPQTCVIFVGRNFLAKWYRKKNCSSGEIQIEPWGFGAPCQWKTYQTMALPLLVNNSLHFHVFSLISLLLHCIFHLGDFFNFLLTFFLCGSLCLSSLCLCLFLLSLFLYFFFVSFFPLSLSHCLSVHLSVCLSIFLLSCFLYFFSRYLFWQWRFCQMSLVSKTNSGTPKLREIKQLWNNK